MAGFIGVVADPIVVVAKQGNIEIAVAVDIAGNGDVLIADHQLLCQADVSAFKAGVEIYGVRACLGACIGDGLAKAACATVVEVGDSDGRHDALPQN